MSKSNANKKILGHLVRNALDFLGRSISELKEQPKYSVIHFYAAIELFLKARLVAEHWSLSVSSKNEADWKEFISGQFVSVTLEEAAKRLDKVVQSGLSENQLKAFREVAKHRNRMVHFYHEAATPENGTLHIQAIVKEQLRAWYLLHDLLSGKWANVFEAWGTEIAEIDVDLRRNHEFLAVVFEMIKSDIETEKEAGLEFRVCPSCAFESDKHVPKKNELYESQCLVCGLTETCIRVKCSQCVGNVLFRGEPNAECDNCSHKHDGDLLRKVLVDAGEAYQAIKDGGYYPFPLNCGDCFSHQTVVQVSDEQFLCTECFAISEDYGTCEWCNEDSTGLSGETYWSGCEFCDGRAGWDKD